MKTLKKATQKNAQINRYYYTTRELYEMLQNHEIFLFGRDENYALKAVYDIDIYDIDSDTEFRIYISDKKEIKVVLDDMGQYTTVCVANDGKEYFIQL